ncbi:MAG: hypothetical protein QXY84_00700 [Candidatus Caldarchaeum sp.]
MREPVLAVVGLGKMGEVFIHHVAKAKAKLAIAVEQDIEKGKLTLQKAGFRYKVARTEEQAQRIFDSGCVVLTDSFSIVSDLPEVNAVVDATGNVMAGAEIAMKSIDRKKDVIMLNAELDATVGPILSRLADLAGVIFTGDIGDEPGAIMHYLFEPLTYIGMEVIVAGKGKNNPLEIHANPTTVYESSLRAKLNPKVLTSFVDGTKTMVEMTLLSNATGMLPDIRGMHGPVAKLEDLAKIFRLKQDGGILNDFHVVDYVIGIAPGVFAIATSDDEVILENMRYLKVGEGPNFVYYRPYHLPGSETLLTVKKAVTERKPAIKARGYFSDVVAFAKRDLKPGEQLDGIGGYTVYGLIEKRQAASESGLLPIGLASHVKVKRSVEKDQPINLDSVEIPDTVLYELWKMQQRL